MKYAVFEPSQGESLEGAVLLMTNEVGARLEGEYHEVRAQAVAGELGVVVLAYQREPAEVPWSKVMSNRSRLKSNLEGVFYDTSVSLTAILDREFDSAASKVRLAGGHSAGGFDAVHLTAAGHLGIDHVVATDPASLHPIGHMPGLHYLKYLLFDENRKPEAQKYQIENIEASITAGPATAISRLVKEVLVYGGQAKMGGTRGAIKKIAKDMPEVGMDIFLPGNTFTSPVEIMHAIKAEAESLRDNDAPAEVSIHIEEDWYHSYFNDYGKFASVLRVAFAQQYPEFL